MLMTALFLATLAASSPGTASHIPSAIYTDPAHDIKNPARMEVLHIPSGDVQINGVAYLAAGAGPHPTIVICHGLPGNEKNLDLAQALRRAGWNAITFNYRGSWGSPGRFSFAHNTEDAKAVLAYIRSPANAKTFGTDPNRIVLAGHSMGGWVAAMVSEQDAGLRGTILISAANMGAMGHQPRSSVLEHMKGDMETLATTTPEAMADEITAHADDYDFLNGATALNDRPLLVLSSDDGLSPMTDLLVTAVRKAGGQRLTAIHVATDHGWSDRRIRLQREILNWLAKLK